jgi:hypothetical protein
VDPSGHFANLTKELVCEYIANTLIHSIDTIIVTAEMGAIIGAIDAKLSGNDIETGIINGLVNGATIGTVFFALGIAGNFFRAAKGIEMAFSATLLGLGYESGFEALKENKYDAASFRFFVSSAVLLGWGCQYGNDLQSSLTNLFGKGVDGKTTSI